MKLRTQVHYLQDFKQFLESRGFRREPLCGYEALRMRQLQTLRTAIRGRR